jgi:hypothetical protein
MSFDVKIARHCEGKMTQSAETDPGFLPVLLQSSRSLVQFILQHKNKVILSGYTWDYQLRVGLQNIAGLNIVAASFCYHVCVV